MRALLAVSACLLASCARLPTDVVPAPSPNFDERRPNYVIIHATHENTAREALAILRDPARKVSAHYLIRRDGALYQLVAEERRAWHAGASWWGGMTDLNSASIGVELDNNGEEAYAEAQIARLLQLLRALKARYRIPQANFLAHSDVAPQRKSDPGVQFPWARLAVEGYGLWCERPTSLARGVDDMTVGLQVLGYDVSDPVAALIAFRRHFLNTDSAAAPDANDMAMLNCLIGQKAMSSAPG